MCDLLPHACFSAQGKILFFHTKQRYGLSFNSTAVQGIAALKADTGLLRRAISNSKQDLSPQRG